MDSEKLKNIEELDKKINKLCEEAHNKSDDDAKQIVLDRIKELRDKKKKLFK